MPRKPTGRIGPITIRNLNANPLIEWSQIKFPEKKEDIEQLIVDLWAAEMRKLGCVIKSIKMNSQDDFDFTIDLLGGVVSLDFHRAIPLRAAILLNSKIILTSLSIRRSGRLSAKSTRRPHR
jgi:hypothetical protein